MLRFLPQWLRGALTIILIFINTVVFIGPIILSAVLKLIIPIRPFGKACAAIAVWSATAWVSMNSAFLALMHKIDWHVTGLEGLKMDGWYLVTSNHQSWADIPIVQHIMNGHAPFLKFFLKQELIWVPLLGLAWWGLDFPFMKRYTKDYLEKHPEMKGKDLETTRKACEKFQYIPVSIFNFLEGTRFTPAKHERQNSPFRNLLKPKAGGVGFVLGAMGAQLDTLIDITIVYPDGNKGFWGLLSGQLKTIVIDVRKIAIPAEFSGKNYLEDEAFREQFQLWITGLWEQKDNRITEMKARYAK